jgi:hypothetical protein
MAELRAFKLREEYQDFGGGSFAYGPLSATFDVGAALEAHEGVITTDDPVLAEALAAYDPLIAAEVPTEAEPVQVESAPAEEPATQSVQSPAGELHEAVPPAEHLDDDLVPDDPEQAGDLGARPAL